jgi:hypothetical protein
MVQPAVATATSHRCLGLGLGAILTTGRRLSTQIGRPVRLDAHNYRSSNHRVLSPRRGSAWELARRMLTLLRPGAPSRGRALDPQRYGVAGGHTWVVWLVLVQWP